MLKPIKMTRVVKMFHINQHKLKARGWATQTELVCQDHNRGFVISLYIIFSNFSTFFLLQFLSYYYYYYYYYLYHHNFFVILFSYYFSQIFFTIMFQLILKNIILCTKKGKVKIHPFVTFQMPTKQ
jgi:hypothetical protein